ncbi:MAG: glycosyltransferase family 39 protein [Anaerolineales bacterium]|nr:glycosyltransferase family 39 protein [Anaerolineales bacterium]
MSNQKHSWIYDILFILVLLVAGYLRIGGYNWGEGYHQHPDELFLTGVLDNLRAKTCEDPSIPVDACPSEQKRWMTPGEYFDSDTSTLNPYNRGYAFFVYGNLPMTLVRAGLEMTGNDNIGSSKFFARQMSALADLFAIFFLYLIVSRLYERKVGLLASAFSALTVMQIQQSHFFTTDLFVNTFLFLALVFAVKIVEWKGKDEKQETGNDEAPAVRNSLLVSQIVKHPLFYLSIGFGFVLGMGMASKINAAAMAFVLPFAFFVRWLIHDRKKTLSAEYWPLILAFLVAGGFATIISFRIFQPYAFDGIGLNEQWVKNISEQRIQAAGEADLPWNLQWARRSKLFSFENLTLWGLGLPLGILAWAGFLLMGWRILKGEHKHILLWGWTAFYFLWQSLQFNPTMRYQLPIYPLLAMMAAWFVFELAGSNVQTLKLPALSQSKGSNLRAIAASMLGITVLALTAVWAFAFQSIYLRDETRMAASRWIFQNVPAAVNLSIQTEDGAYNQPVPAPYDHVIYADAPLTLVVTPAQEGILSEVLIGRVRDESETPAPVLLTVFSASQPDLPLARASSILDSTLTTDPRGLPLTLTLDAPVPLVKDQQYILRIETLGTALSLSGSGIANETDYDWGLPFRIDGYDAFGGLYRGDLILQVYWADDEGKLERFVDTLSRADYIVIPTNHQYGQITRLPERYPLTTHYYRELLGCPQGENIIHCYYEAQPGMYQGSLGFGLAEVFESYPTLGPIVINDSYAEEAFTFYDHPKVLIFKKTDDFDADRVRAILGTVDLTKVVPLKPTEFADYKTLMLPESRLAQQRAGGTWSELFSYDWLQNKYPFIGVLVWYAFILILGLVAYPIARLALPGLKQYAYPLGRIVGLVLLAWLAWMGGSVGIPYTRGSISVAFALVAVTGVGLWMKRKDEFKGEWDANRRFFVIVEIVFLAFFLIDLLIRFGNSDMWHPSKGGERPMDFSYFNAVLKSTSFPPYDPWFAGGYINYYYYGFVMAGTPVKLLGIVPSIAYNFILPTWFALVAIGAFAIGWNLMRRDEDAAFRLPPSALISGLAASLLTVFLGNLGTIQLIFNSIQRIAAPGGTIPPDANLIQRWGWAFQGLWTMITQGVALPIGRGDWYWNPSRVIPHGPGNEITEFPLFTFLYSDLHAHMLVMPLALFIIAWALSFIRSRAKLTLGEWIASFAVGALMIGALKPTNTWDLYTYYLLAAIAAAYTLIRYFEWKDYFNLPAWAGKVALAVGAAVTLYALSSIFYLPFSQWFGQAYNSVDFWEASRTPLSSYFTQWGLFLFIITAWLAWETRAWMAATPVSHLSGLRKYVLWIELVLAAFIAILVFLVYDGVRIGLVALPLAFWAATLLLRPDLPDTKRFVLFLVGTALAITIAVELVALVGDIGRMNTIFKLYLQAWMMFAVSAAAAFGWLLGVFPSWTFKWRTIYQIGTYALLFGAFLFTLTASTDKINDRISVDTPRTLDGMTFMNHAQLWDGQTMDLSQDYRAIRWMQDNIEGSPVIVEANCSEYRWCTRYTIYTGLPGVVGWNWHQRQQRGIFASQVQDRVNEVSAFYNTPDVQTALDFLKKYDVKYIVVGQLERNVYPALLEMPDGLAKFDQYEGIHWRTVYQDADTTIYEVIP